MPELQAIIDFSIQINKFINIDLFQRGFYQIRLSLKLPNCKLPNKIELQQQNQNSFIKNKSDTSFNLISNNVDNDVDSKKGDDFYHSQEPNSGNIVLPQCIVNGMAVSKTFQINYKNEEIILNDFISYRMNICLDIINCIKQIQNTDILLEVELWYSDQEFILNQYDTIFCVSSRKLRIHLDLCRGIHYCLPVIFDYFHLSAVTIAIHGCLITLCQPYILGKNECSITAPLWLSSFIKSDNKIDKKFSNNSNNELERKQNSLVLQQWRLQLAHWKLVSIILLSLIHLKKIIDEYYRILPPWQQAKINYETLFVKISSNNLNELTLKCFTEIENNLQDELNDSGINDLSTMIGKYPEDTDLLSQVLQESLDDKKIEDSINIIEHDVGHLCGLIIEQWQRFLLLMINSNDRINQHLAKTHHFQRIRRFSEAFFYIEQPRDNLNSLCDQNSNLFLELSDYLRKSAYFINLPPCDVECVHLDGDFNTLPIIFEEKYEHSNQNNGLDSNRKSVNNNNSNNNNKSNAIINSPSKLSLSSSSTSSSNSPKSNLRNFFSRLNNNTNDRSSSTLSLLKKEMSPTQIQKMKNSSNTEISTLELFELYKLELFKDSNNTINSTDIDLMNKKIKLLNTFINRKNLIKNYSQLSLEFSNEKMKNSIKNLQQSSQSQILKMNENHENSYSWPNLSPDISLNEDVNTFPVVNTNTLKSSFRRITNSNKKKSNQHKNKHHQHSHHHYNNHGSKSSTSSPSSTSLHVFPVMNYRNFSGTMYFPKPPKEFAMQELDEPETGQEFCMMKPIPIQTSSKKSNINNNNNESNKINIQDDGQKEEAQQSPTILVDGINLNELSLNNKKKTKNVRQHQQDHHQSHHIKINNSHSFQDLTEEMKSMDGVDNVNNDSNNNNSKTNMTMVKMMNQQNNTTKDDIVLKKSDNQLNILNNTKFTFMELLKSDHCLICCRSIVIDDKQQQAQPQSSSSSATTTPLMDDSWPCKCTQKTKKSNTNQQQKSATSDSESSSQQQTSTTFKRVSTFDFEFIQFLHEKEAFRASISDKFKNLIFYSDFHTLASRIPYFQCESDLKAFTDLHLIVCVHGLDGNSADLRLVKTYLEIGLPTNNFEFLMSQRNQGETFDDLETLTDRLINEIDNHVITNKLNPTRISFIGHSLGSIIIRAATSRQDFVKRWNGKLHTFLSLSGPHLGLAYNRSGLVNLGLWFIQKFKKAPSLNQLSMKDSQDVRQTFLYRLSQKPSLEYFRNILLCGSSQDRYVPIHSAHIELCNAATNDTSDYGIAYREMTENILKRLIANTEINIIRYDVHHALNSNTNTLIGRAAHIAVLDSELFIEKFMMVAGLKYFV